MFRFLKRFDKWYWHLISMYMWGAIIGPLLVISGSIYLILIDLVLFLLLAAWTVKIMINKETVPD